MDNKTLSVISYITIIGWIISFVMGKDNANSLLKYHLRQSFGLFIFGIVLGIALRIIMSITGLYFLGYIGLINFALMIIGIINAANEAEKPLPLIGKMFEDKFAFVG
ncbi:import component protein [Elizabethkingia ursingii]|uniref:Import component protein n=1 Tax=Elizabethkingia ursingii TaxID=1756150 RepID=A0ABX3N6J3_9FLAO|nr:import component protein [Elizabethkingia ursingii]KUY31118.1 import component protein [Elizabethkingia ursingii]OPB87046.1 import component protein [Elizabethkingia ursingii]OPC00261.1 import component protein [Elizabethkingia ursingii]